MSVAKQKVLFVAEAVTLAHVARIYQLANSLDPDVFDVTVAADTRYASLFPADVLKTVSIRSISSQCFMDALAAGKPAYDFRTLVDYVEEDLTLLEKIKPNLIVGDFRLSLQVSARLVKVPYANIINAYWSPYASRTIEVPELPLVKLVGYRIAQQLFNIARPIAFALHSRSINKVRRHFGLSKLPADLMHAYCDGDYTLYADVPNLFEMKRLPSHHRFIGPVLWSPDMPLPGWWGRLESGAPIVYLTPGSSGSLHLLGKMVETLSHMGVQIIISTAKRSLPADVSEQAFCADYLPGVDACAIADGVICNGGSPTCYQALALGKPVLGVPSNLDQYLNMEGIVRYGAGLTLRSDESSEGLIASTTKDLLYSSRLRGRSQALSHEIADWEFARRFREFAMSH